jgi:two-component system chemotaxis response regulator CheY
VRALVIDDSRAMRAILSGILRPAGFEVTQAGDGREGLDRLADAGPFDLALVDWNMPVMNGLEFVRAVRQSGRHPRMTVVMVTTETEHSQMVLALTAGAHEYVMKPFTPDILLGKLQLLGVTPA